jgi:hypothetical protein
MQDGPLPSNCAREERAHRDTQDRIHDVEGAGERDGKIAAAGRSQEMRTYTVEQPAKSNVTFQQRFEIIDSD